MKHRTHNTVLFLLGMGFGLCQTAYATSEPGEPTGEITLTQALTLAENRHPELKSRQLETQAAEGRVTQAAARQNPTLSFNAENFGGKDEQKGFGAAEYTAQIEQTFELGGKRNKRLHVATIERQLAGFDLETQRLDIRAETNRRFVGVLAAQARLNLARETVEMEEDFVKTVAARVGAGKVPQMELDKAHVLLAQRRIALDLAVRVLETTRIQLAAQWGSVRPTFERVTGDLTVVGYVPSLSILASQLHRNPDVARCVIETERTHAVLAKEKAFRVPDLTVAAGIRRSNESDTDTLAAGVSLPLPVFDRNGGSIREAGFLLAKAEQQRRAAVVKAAADLATAHQMLAAASNRASAVNDDVLPRVKAVFAAVQSGYTQGKYTYLEVLDAQRTLVESQVEHIDALVSARTTLADIERIVGGQLPVQKQD